MKITNISSIILFLIGIHLNAQNLIGYNEADIRKYMAENKKDMSFQNFVNNSTFKYLKYCDNTENQTLLIFLTEKLICKSVRLICDKNLKAQKIKEYDGLYKKKGNGQWTETKNGKNYLIEMKEEDYTFNITIKLNE
jgi:hypothetical protein